MYIKTLLRANSITASQMFLRYLIELNMAEQQFNQYTGFLYSTWSF
jgi:hypothetical protein